MARINDKVVRKLRRSAMVENGKNTSISEVSKNIGIHHASLTRMEYDESYEPGIFTLLKVSDYFNVKLEDLIIRD